MPDFFDTPVLLMFFVSMGKTIEAKARSVTAHSLSAVGSKSLPDAATLVTPNGLFKFILHPFKLEHVSLSLVALLFHATASLLKAQLQSMKAL